MPTYEARCAKCGQVHTYRKSIAERDDTPTCCDSKTERGIYTAPDGFVDFPATGQKRVYGPPAWRKD